MAIHNVTIARSGVYYYGASELLGLGLSTIPMRYLNKNVFGVYRPSYMMENTRHLFDNVPLVLGHDKWLTKEDLKSKDVLGKVVETPQIKIVDGECILYSKVDITNPDYDHKDLYLSPGFDCISRWEEGVAPSGEEYQIILEDITEVNHLAIVDRARGGDKIKILDGNPKDKIKHLFSGLLYNAKRFGKAKDGDAFLNTIQDVSHNIERWTPEETAEHVTTLLALLDDYPSTEELNKLTRFIKDIPALQGEDKQTIDNALQMIRQLYEEIDNNAKSDGSVKESTLDDTNNKNLQEPAPVEPVNDKPTDVVADSDKVNNVEPPASTQDTVDPEDTTSDSKGTEEDKIGMLVSKIDELIACLSAHHSAPVAPDEPPSVGKVIDSAFGVPTQTLTTDPKTVGENSLEQLFNSLKG